MKMKRLSRLTALLLAIMLTLSMIPAALAEESYDVSTMAEYIEMRDDLIAAMQAPATENGVLTPSELVFLSRSYTNVADFGAPAVGAAPRMRMMALAANPAAADTDSNGVVLSKTATKNEDGTYTLRLETYATGAKVTQTVTEEIPTDIILVLDQSGSMANSFTTATEQSFQAYGNRSNSYFWNRYQAENLYYPIPDDAYVAVTVERSLAGASYTAYEANTQNYEYYRSYYSLYVKIGDAYYPVTVDRDGSMGNRTYTYSYSVNGNTISYTSSGAFNNPAGDDSFPFPLYRESGSGTYQYTYSYVNESNEKIVIGTSTGDNENGPSKLYQMVTSSSSTSRLAALKSAVTTFVNAVATKAAGADGDLSTAADNINHRIAVVGFASQSGYGNNTEILSVAGTNSGSVGVAYNNLGDAQYKSALQSMDTSAGQTMVNNSINALAAEGATQADLGMEMAEDIFAANPIDANTKRNRVVIMFTDGSPTYENGFKLTVANSAISSADKLRSTYSATVYSVGIFDGADATSFGTEPSGDLSQNSSRIAAASNWFMQEVSNNEGTPQTPSYYLSAADSSKLNTIFQQISDQIESGGASVTLTEEAVIRDIISDSFDLPAGANPSSIKVYTADYIAENTFKDPPVAYTDAVITITGSEGDNKDVSVTNFDFSENWVGTETTNGSVTYRGKKLIIEIPIVVRDGFLGGNNVTTNLAASGIYENASAKEALENFVSPVTDVAIPEVVVTAAEKNVYLLGDLSNDQLLAGATVTVGDEVLDFNAVNFGLEEWQNAYVDISGPASANAYSDLTADTTFTISATVTPTSEGPVKAVSDSSDDTNINVFKPVLKFQDTTVDYMSTVENPGDFDANNYVVSERSDDTTPVLTEYPQWVHNGTLAASAKPQMIGEEPALKLTYNPDAGIDNSGVVVSTTDVAVDVTVSIVTGKDESTNAFTYRAVTDHVTFIRAACDHAGCANNEVSTHQGNEDAPEFVLHVINVVGNLTITKSGLNVNTYAKTSEYSDYESAIFTVSGDYDGDGKEDIFTVVIPCPGPEGSGSVTLTGLRVGKYKVTEQTGWTWRYGTSTITDSYVVDGESTASDGVVKVEGNQTAKVECVNSVHTDKWLGGDNYATNVFGKSN